MVIRQWLFARSVHKYPNVRRRWLQHYPGSEEALHTPGYREVVIDDPHQPAGIIETRSAGAPGIPPIKRPRRLQTHVKGYAPQVVAKLETSAEAYGHIVHTRQRGVSEGRAQGQLHLDAAHIAPQIRIARNVFRSLRPRRTEQRHGYKRQKQPFHLSHMVEIRSQYRQNCPKPCNPGENFIRSFLFFNLLRIFAGPKWV